MQILETTKVLYTNFSRYRWHMLVLVVLGFLGAILEGIGINAVIPLISFFTGGGGESTDFISTAIRNLFGFFSIPFTFRFLLSFILTLFILRAVAVVVFGYIRGWVTTDYMCDESESMLRRTMLASWPFLLKQKLGTLHNVLVRDIQRSSALLEIVGQIIQSLSGFSMYLLVAINISPITTLYTLIGGAVLVLFGRPLLIRNRRTADLVIQQEKLFSQFLSEHIIGTKSIKAAGVERLAIRQGNTYLRALRALSLRMALIRSGSASMFQPFSLIFVIVLFMVSYKSPGFSIVSFGATLYLIQKIFTYLESGINALHSVNETLPYVKSLATYKKMLEENREETVIGKKPMVFNRQLAFENVSFSYNGDSSVLSDISFTLPRGQTIGLIGPSGAGKTTMADLLLRLFEPTKGKITLDGERISDISIDEWRRNVGYVSQDVFLLNDTIAENIRFYSKEISKEDIIAAAKQANIYNYIMSLPEGFETTVGDRGVLLSGGQRQRVVLARALARRPKLLILDEATSALDSESEKLIQESIRTLHGNVTVFVIAHRLSTIENADMLLVLENKELSEVGTPEELRKNPNSYFVKHHDRPKTQ
ncbi:MAG: ATP-binding cassette, subfamily C, bacterial [Parcubacteria group bacterium Gr01-1014_56]|nr:MAG: ATP-binding cassette, subfamily C, bacterial [Parcubacteria group bacterium Gr01-1014_56]